MPNLFHVYEFRFEQALDGLIQAFSQLEVPLVWEGGAPNLEPRASNRPTDPAFILTGDGQGAARLIQLPAASVFAASDSGIDIVAEPEPGVDIAEVRASRGQ